MYGELWSCSIAPYVVCIWLRVVPLCPFVPLASLDLGAGPQCFDTHHMSGRGRMTSTKTFLVRCTNDEDANLLRASARLFFEHGIYVIEKLLNLSCKLQTFSKYCFMDSSLALYVPLTWLVTNSESVKTCKWWISSLMDSSKPVINALYYDSLLEVGNSKRKAYVISFPSGSVKMRLAPAPSLLHAPSVYNVQTGTHDVPWA
ncbi:hypothetical protein Tco_0831225 [Tanacetum coccineum]